MGDLPHISVVDSAEKFYRVVHEANESLRNDKVLAYLNQTGLINYNEQKQCENGHVMDLKKSKTWARGQHSAMVSKLASRQSRPGFDSQHC